MSRKAGVESTDGLLDVVEDEPMPYYAPVQTAVQRDKLLPFRLEHLFK